MEQHIRYELGGSYVSIHHGGSLMYAYIDSFVALSRENASVTEVDYVPLIGHRGTMSFGTKWVKLWAIS
jgi:hypothetical protein